MQLNLFKSVKTSQHPASVSSVLNANHLWKPVSSSLYMWLQPIGLLLLLLLVEPNSQGRWLQRLNKTPDSSPFHTFVTENDLTSCLICLGGDLIGSHTVCLNSFIGTTWWRHHVTNKSKQHRTGVSQVDGLWLLADAPVQVCVLWFLINVTSNVKLMTDLEVRKNK